MLRTERPGDMLPVYELVSAAFGRPDEAELVNRLRECGAAVVTMVEEEEYEFMGHLMLSPITIEGQEGPDVYKRQHMATEPNCGTPLALVNNAPQVAAGNDYVIPANTPFVLKGAGADLDSDCLLYTSW